jgi:hypothetical protein
VGKQGSRGHPGTLPALVPDQHWGFTPQYRWAYDGIMAKQEQIALTSLLADPRAVFDRVAEERATISVMSGEEAIAVISPAPVAESLAELHRAMLADDLDSSFSLDAMETRRLLGL